MKEKIKNFFTNKTLWEYIIGFFVLIILLFVSYSKGFVDGVLIDDEIRTELIDTTLDETKKSKIEPKKANDIVRLNPNDYYDKYVKFGFDIDENFINDFYLACNENPVIDHYYSLIYTIDDSVFCTLVFTDSQVLGNFSLELSINGNYFVLSVSQGTIEEVALEGIFEEQITGGSIPLYLNDLGITIANYWSELGLDNYYLNFTEYDDNITYSDFTNYVYVYDIQPPKSFLSEFLSGAVDLVTGFGAVLTASVVCIGSIFYSNGELTIVGSAMALALGVGAIYLLFRMIRGLIKQNNRG